MAGSDGDEMYLQGEFEGPILPWDRFRRWVTCFCVVTFDIELGQALEVGVSKLLRFIESLMCSFEPGKCVFTGSEHSIIYKHVVVLFLMRLDFFAFSQLVYPGHIELTDREVSKSNKILDIIIFLALYR